MATRRCSPPPKPKSLMVKMPGCLGSEKLIQEAVVPRAPFCGK